MSAACRNRPQTTEAKGAGVRLASGPKACCPCPPAAFERQPLALTGPEVSPVFHPVKFPHYLIVESGFFGSPVGLGSGPVLTGSRLERLKATQIQSHFVRRLENLGLKVTIEPREKAA